MIISNKKNVFGKCGRIKTDSYSCIVSTAKEGVAKPMSTMILEGNPYGTHNQTRSVGKIIYTDSLKRKEILQFHDALVNYLGETGDKFSQKLGDALEAVFDDFKKRGIAKEAINVAEKSYENSKKYQIQNANFYQATLGVKKWLQIVQSSSNQNAQDVLLKTELKEAIDMFLKNPCEETAIPMLNIAPEFLMFFK